MKPAMELVVALLAVIRLREAKGYVTPNRSPVDHWAGEGTLLEARRVLEKNDLWPYPEYKDVSVYWPTDDNGWATTAVYDSVIAHLLLVPEES